MSNSISEGFFRIRVQMSMVKMVEDELKIEVKELIKAANMTDNIKPVNPVALSKGCSRLSADINQITYLEATN